MRRLTPCGSVVFAILAGFALVAPAAGQFTPVIGRGATAFDPEVSVVNSGAVINAQAVVSHDRRYVTITMGAQQASLIELRPFPVQATAGVGFVGGANPGGSAPLDPDRPGAAPAGAVGGDGVGGFDTGGFPIVTDPTPGELSDPDILNRRGMIRLSHR